MFIVSDPMSIGNKKFKKKTLTNKIQTDKISSMNIRISSNEINI